MKRKANIVALGLILLFLFGSVCTTLAAPSRAVLRGEMDSPCARGGWLEMECDQPNALCTFGLASTLSANPALSSAKESLKDLSRLASSDLASTLPGKSPPVPLGRRDLASRFNVLGLKKTSIHLFNSVLTL